MSVPDCSDFTFPEKLLNAFSVVYWQEELPYGTCLRLRRKALREIREKERIRDGQQPGVRHHG
ncbi:hypothetical protein QKT49_gp301 [Acanthamoeba castellanii medusavirus]|uniref:Uncharacterized protein n=1 Tax=Acanthamoeba castellanii medusavirus J1 TaxID=3114988 RepID=A0A3T1CX94_9VIRU|nr:hypothetical protein QKT49_gp301 [Acanthamoeba castellanii medusavirus]BBI30462.1 hypothetical protein [Acanthamoeba castellanii medusavirus J1]